MTQSPSGARAGRVAGPPGFESLTALDASFVAIETDCNYMHIALAGVFEHGQHSVGRTRLDMARLHVYAMSVLEHLPKFRQRLARVPVLGHPVLVDDDRFDLNAHLRYIELPSPGSEAQLKDLVSRIYSEPLDRSRPLWEQWFIDGLEGHRFAVVTKAHHCLLDGVAGVAAIAAMLRTTDDATVSEAPSWIARPAPSGGELLAAELVRRLGIARQLWSSLETAGLLASVRTATAGVLSTLKTFVKPSSKTLLNPRHVCPLRQFEWLRIDLNVVRDIRRATATKINDVVLAIVTGGVRRYFLDHGVDVRRLNFRAMVPMSLHESADDGMRNRVSLMLTPLPIDTPDPGERLARVARAMQAAKSSNQGRAFALLEQLADLTLHGTLTLSAKVMTRLRPFNVIVTNVPGPQFPLYLLGSRLLDAYPMVPLYLNQAVGIAILSYDGSLYFGLNADPEHVPDLPHLRTCLLDSYRELAVCLRIRNREF